MKLKIVKKSECKEILEIARKWGKWHHGFGSARSTAMHAVAEFLANQKGKAIFEYMVDVEMPITKLTCDR